VVKRLKNELQEWYESILKSERSYTIPTFPIGFPDEREIRIVAEALIRSGGNVQGENLGSSDWLEPGDFQTMSVEVLQSGTYHIALEYDIDKVNRATVEVAVGEKSVKGIIRGKTHTDLGTLDLPKGKTELTVRILSKEEPTPVFRILRAVTVTKKK